jgi:hypothetical protein
MKKNKKSPKKEVIPETVLFFEKLCGLTGQKPSQICKKLGWSRQKYHTYRHGLVHLWAKDPKLLGQKLNLKKSQIKQLWETLYL